MAEIKFADNYQDLSQQEGVGGTPTGLESSCSACSNEIEPGAKFRPECGHRRASK